MNVRHRLPSFLLLLALAATASSQSADRPAWKSLPIAEPKGESANTGSYTVKDSASAAWKKPPFAYHERAATGRKEAKVVVLIHDPILESEGGVRMTEWLKA